MSSLTCVFDFETSGLTLHPNAPIEKQPRAIEFGGALISNETGEIEEEISILINPGIKLDAKITEITHLTDDDLKDAPTFIEVLPQLRRIFGAATGVIAHNLPFDKAIMRGELMRANVLDFPWPRQELCTVGVHFDEWGRNPRLIELYESVTGKKYNQTHRALDDVRALVEIVQIERLWQFLS